MSRLKTFVIRLALMLMLSLLSTISYADDPTWHLDTTPGYGNFRQAVWKPDGEYIAIASAAGVQIYTAAMEPVVTVSQPGAADLAWQDNHIAIATSQGIFIWNVNMLADAAPAMLREIPPGKAPMAWSPDGQWLAFADEEAQIWLLNIETGSSRVAFREHSFQSSAETGAPRMYALAWSPDSTRIASTAARTGFKIWNAETGEVVTALDVSTDSLGAMRWRDDRRLEILKLNGTSRMSIFSVEAGTPTPEQVFQVDPGILSAAFSPDGTSVALLTNGRRLYLIDPATLDVKDSEMPAVSPEGIIPPEGDWSVAWSPEGRTLITGLTGTVYQWQVEDDDTLTLTRTIDDAYMGWLTALAWSPDGTRLASIHGELSVSGDGNDNRLRLWDAATHDMLWRTDGAN